MANARAVISRFHNPTAARPKRLRSSSAKDLMHPLVHGNQAQSLTELQVPAGQRTDMHRHREAEELYYVLSGRGRMQVGDDSFQVAAGDVIAVPPGAPHRIECAGSVRMRVLLCSTPPHSTADTECLEPPTVPELPELLADELEDALETDPTAPPLIITSGAAAVKLRKSLKQNQRRFWQRIGITQSGASRYELGRRIPLTVQYLLHVAYATDHDSIERLFRYLRRPLESTRIKPSRLPSFGTADGPRVLVLRLQLGINQSKFWASVGVTQSAGSRYENGRSMPPTVSKLLEIVYAQLSP